MDNRGNAKLMRHLYCLIALLLITPVPAYAQSCAPTAGKGACTENFEIKQRLFTSVANVTATGTDQGSAVALADQTNIITAGAAATGVVIPSGATGMAVLNRTSSTKNVYPNSGAQFDALGANVPITLGAKADIIVFCVSTTQCTSIPPTQ